MTESLKNRRAESFPVEMLVNESPARTHVLVQEHLQLLRESGLEGLRHERVVLRPERDDVRFLQVHSRTGRSRKVGRVTLPPR